MKTTKTYAKEILNLWKGNARCFNGIMTEAQFENKLLCMGFDQADAIAITMALVLAGANFANG